MRLNCPEQASVLAGKVYLLTSVPAAGYARSMPGESENQFSLTRAALSTSSRPKSNFLSIHLGRMRSLCFGCVLACAGPAVQALAAAEAGTGDVFKLRAVSVFAPGQNDFQLGQAATCEDKPSAAVRHYPVFTSKKPVYGSVCFAEERGQTNGLVFHFALDESRGTGKGYDRLYFDLNRDLDLRNDAVVMPHKQPPAGSRATSRRIKQQVVFECLKVDFDCGAAGKRAVELLPLMISSVYREQEHKLLRFTRMHLYEGEITVAGERFTAQLGNNYTVYGRLDVPGTLLKLTPKDSEEPPYRWLGGDNLTAAHKIHGRFFTFSASPTGDQLRVRPYEGELGTFEIGPGGRGIDKLSFKGSLEAKALNVPVGGEIEHGWPKAARRCQIPVGDYAPGYISVEFGRLMITIARNYHSEGSAFEPGKKEILYGMTVRKDKPCMLDFSNKPDVLFASPPRAQKFKRGDSIEFQAVLVDPKLDFMIRGLEDTSRQQTTDANGQPLGYKRNLSLDPKVLITRANGEKVAEGVMPFG